MSENVLVNNKTGAVECSSQKGMVHSNSFVHRHLFVMRRMFEISEECEMRLPRQELSAWLCTTYSCEKVRLHSFEGSRREKEFEF